MGIWLKTEDAGKHWPMLSKLFRDETFLGNDLSASVESGVRLLGDGGPVRASSREPGQNGRTEPFPLWGHSSARRDDSMEKPVYNAPEALRPTVTLYEIEAPLIAKKAQPGQFIILRVDEKLQNDWKAGPGF